MADTIMIAALVCVIFLILRDRIRKLRRGQSGGGCAGCSGCRACDGCRRYSQEDPGVRENKNAHLERKRA